MLTQSPNRPTRDRLGLLLAGSLVLAQVAVFVPGAAASECEGQFCPPADPSAYGGGGTFVVEVSGSGTSGGGTVQVPMSEVSEPPLCWMEPYWTGAEYAAGWEPGGIFYNWDTHPNVPEADKFEPYPDYEDYVDQEGHWWIPRCRPYGAEDIEAGIPDDIYAFFAAHDSVFIVPGDQPTYDIDPVFLALFAQERLDLPDPELGWNPQRAPDAATLVNLDTWVWLENSPAALDVTASAGGTSATVVATLETMAVSAPYADPVECTNAGVAWAADVDPADACAIVFGRSSAIFVDNLTPVTVETTWGAEWFTGGVSQGDLDPQTVSDTTQIPVAEVQTIVTGG